LLERLIPAGAARFGVMPVTTHGMLATSACELRVGRSFSLHDSHAVKLHAFRRPA
jgi:hypothetical protein